MIRGPDAGGTCNAVWVAGVALLAGLGTFAPGPRAAPLAAQGGGLTGYYLNLWTRADDSVLGAGGGSGFQRLRLMWEPRRGPASLEVAYEHTLALQDPGASGAQLLAGAAGTLFRGDWVTLGGDLHASEGVRWRHRFDRLNVRLDLGPNADLTLGRQSISWATTLFLTPADPFAPFDPADPFREYRGGVDAARLRYYRGAFTQLEVVARPARTGAGGTTTLTLAARATTNRAGWDLGFWAGAVHDSFGAALSASGAVGLWALRGEFVLRSLDGEAVVRGAVGADRTLALGGRDLHLAIEYQHDGFGAASPDELLRVATGRAYRQGEVQVPGRDVGAVQLSWPLHPLLSANTMVMGSLRDGSLLIGPGLSYSATASAAFRAGAFTGTGAEAVVGSGGVGGGSEFGSVPLFIYASVNFFF